MISIIRNDITKMKLDAIVNAANESLLGGGGVDGAIHREGGEEILRECMKLGGCPTGNAKLTTGGRLKSKFVIHTVGPIYSGHINDKILLEKCYINSLKLADEKKFENIAFPSISTGAYGYPIEKAARIAINSVIKYVKNSTNLKEIIFVLYSKKDYNIYAKILENNKELINLKVD